MIEIDFQQVTKRSTKLYGYKRANRREARTRRSIVIEPQKHIVWGLTCLQSIMFGK